MMGGVNNGYIGTPAKSRLGNKALSWFVQDTWKVTRKFTFDYGIRYDFQTYLKEQYGRIGYFSPSTPNPAAGGRLGGLAFDGTGPGRCQCNVAHNYPWAFAPRLGFAYQITPTTVFRGGIGLSYYRTAMNGYNSLSTGFAVYLQRKGPRRSGLQTARWTAVQRHLAELRSRSGAPQRNSFAPQPTD
ncbi:MAG: TonB-dependent receptor [Acidobacteriota bacterium]